jgi:histidinol phosphatase-like enzyme
VSRPKTICFDLDGVICSQTPSEYDKAEPNAAMIAMINRFHDEGYRIIIHTARFMSRAGGDPARARELGDAFTRAQLEGWGLKFDELYLGKPSYDLLVDDRAAFFDPDCSRIDTELRSRLGD